MIKFFKLKILLLVGVIIFFLGCSHQLVVDNQKFALENIKSLEYDFSLIKTKKEARDLNRNVYYGMWHVSHQTRLMIESSYLSKDELAQLDYEEIYNGLEKLTYHYSKNIRNFSIARVVADDALYFARLSLQKDQNPKSLVNAYKNFARIYREEKKYIQALEQIDKALSLAKKLLENKSIVLANVYYEKSMIYYSMDNYRESILYLHKGIDVLELLDYSERINLMVYYDKLSKFYAESNQADKARISLKKVYEVMNYEVFREYTKGEKLLLSRERDRITQLTLNLQKLIESSSLSKQQLSKINYHNKYNLMYKLSSIFREEGRFNKALESGKSSLFFAKIISNQQENDLTIKSYTHLAHIYLEMEKYSKALDCVQKAIGISKEILDEKSLIFADAYLKEALIYRAVSQDFKAIKSIRKAIAISNTEENKQVLLGLTSTTKKQKNYLDRINFSYDERLRILKTSLLATQTKYGAYHYRTAEVYSEMSKLYLLEDKTEEALTYARENYEIKKKVFGEKSFKIVDDLRLVSNIYLARDNQEKAYEFAKKSVKNILEARKSVFLELSTNAKLELDKFNIDYFLLLAHSYIRGEYLNPFSSKEEAHKIQKVVREVFNIWLRYKNEITNTESYLIMLKRKTQDIEVKSKLDKLIRTKKEYSKLFLKQISNFETFSSNEKQKLAKLKEQKDELEVYLSSKIFDYKEYLKVGDINSWKISRKLKEGELYIDFGHIKENNMYFSFRVDPQNRVTFDIVNQKWGGLKTLIKFIHRVYLTFVDVEEEKYNKYVSIDELVKELREDILQEKLKKEDRYKKSFNTKNAKKLYQELFSKHSVSLRFKSEAVSRAKKLIISPDGLLNLVPFEVLMASNKYLIEEKEIIYVSSGKDFLKAHQEKNNASQTEEIVVFSYLDYNANGVSSKEKNKSEEEKKALLTLVNQGRPLKRLRHTKNEGTFMQNIFSKYNVKSYRENNGVKGVLEELRSPKILHLSTHSIYAEDNNQTREPLLKSAMALSGYNEFLSSTGSSRGIMTALEFSNLNLYNTELVLFSSCQSGLGDIHSSEGVYGLNKGAKLAGAKRIISTLWSVADKESVELTKRFYEHLKENEMKEYAGALKATKIDMIKNGSHPFYWAGFVENGID